MHGDGEEVTMNSGSTSVSVPKTMKAEVIERFGSPDEVMHTATIPVPEIGDNEILIEVRSAGIGVWDPYLCKGLFGAEAGLPRVLGSDGSGTVVAVGSKVRRFQQGDRVYASGFMNPKGGFYAEYAAVPESDASKVPSGLSLEQAGVLAVDGLTALAGLDMVKVARGKSLMIVGASGGVGHLAVELAKRMGALVLAIASGADGVDLARRLGADEAIDGRGKDVAAKVRVFAPDGVDGALLLTGSDAAGIEALLGLVKDGGRIAYPNGVPAPRERSGVSVHSFDGYHGSDALTRFERFVAMGPFHVEVSRTYRLEETPKALGDVARHHLGKLAVAVHGA
jgi:NADPH:quinone reductase-like Zn-dependent oxidoreductase